MRKIVSVSVAGVANTSQTQCDFITTALCDDGTVWQAFGHQGEWYCLPQIPQPVDDAKAREVNDGKA